MKGTGTMRSLLAHSTVTMRRRLEAEVRVRRWSCRTNTTRFVFIGNGDGF